MEDSLYDASIDLMNSQCGRLHNLVVDLVYSDYGMANLAAWSDTYGDIFSAGNDIAEKQELRKLPPSHYLSKIESFSTLLESTEIEQYVTNAFEAGGYKWLVLRTHTKGGDNDSISLRLAMVERDDMPLGCDVNVKARFFLYDQIRDRYLVFEEFTLRIMDQIKDNHIERKGDGWFEDASDWMKSPESLSLSGLKNRSNDYLVDNKLIIQAKISCMCVVKTF
ncbi:hypothetical protein POTOM_055375 [Populus tomentosa]|uniref:MATH domain-containing protein n=1 Tax=Populus tomentosa TaxID=118781 RepID=A0A8X8C765_POPTO|nr:hypothetical protein POTOM_055375 [Populus tomentosa]